MSRNEIASPVTALADLLAVQPCANPPTRPGIHTQPGLRLIHRPSNQTVGSRDTHQPYSAPKIRECPEGLNTETRER